MVGFATGRRGDGIMVSCGSRGQRHPGIEGMKQISIERVGHEEPVMAPNTEVLVRRLDVPSLRDHLLPTHLPAIRVHLASRGNTRHIIPPIYRYIRINCAKRLKMCHNS